MKGERRTKMKKRVESNLQMLLILFVLFLSTTLVSCSAEDGNFGSSNPFVGVWKEGSTKWEFKRNGEFISTPNYYSSYRKWTETGTYGYNAQNQTLSMTYDESGKTYIYIVQSCSSNRIVYYDPKDMYTWTLIKAE